jgi:hypothetical protein
VCVCFVWRQEAVIVRFDEERCDLIKLLIIGGLDTPYAAGCFEYHIWYICCYTSIYPAALACFPRP